MTWIGAVELAKYRLYCGVASGAEPANAAVYVGGGRDDDLAETLPQDAAHGGNPSKLAVEALTQQYLEQLLAKPAEVEPHPDEICLREWLSNDLVEGKFTPWWHQKIAIAKEWRIPYLPIWDVLASLFDRVFPDTCNVFNQFDPRRHVTEEVLYPHLARSHALSSDECKKLRLYQLAGLLQGDLERALAGGAKPAVATPKKSPTPADRRTLKRPPDAAFRAWHTRDALAITSGESKQGKIADTMTKNGIPATQGQVSKWLIAVEKYLKAGGIMPAVAELDRIDTVDPDVIDMGRRQDGRTPRQRLRRDSDADSDAE